MVILWCKQHSLTHSYSRAMAVFWLQSLILFVFLVQNCSLNLIVNIRGKYGDIVQQNFFADPEKDFVTIDFKNNEGRYVQVYIDFRLVSLMNYVSDMFPSVISLSYFDLSLFISIIVIYD